MLAEELAGAVAAEEALVLAMRRGRLSIAASHPAGAAPALTPAAVRALTAALETREPIVLEGSPAILGGASLLLLPVRHGEELLGGIALAGSPMPSAAVREMLAGALPLAAAHLRTWLELDEQTREPDRVTTDLLQRMSDLTPFPVQTFDIDGRVVRWSKACVELFGWPEEEALRAILPTVVPERRPVVLAELREMAQTMRHAEREAQQLRKDGSRVTTRIGLYPITDERDRFVVLAITRQVYEDSRVDRLRDEFCDLLSGSLKTPLAAIAGFAQLLRRSEIVEDQLRRQRVLDSLQAQTWLLDTTIDDLLLVSEVREGGLKLDRVPTDLVAVVIECVAEAERAFPGRRFVVDVECRLPKLRADAQRLRQAVAHLLANAATYSAVDGEVWVTVSRDHTEGVLTVRDAGEGIPPEDLPRVFDRFVRGSRARGAGAGVGLYLGRLIAEAHGGAIGVESALGEGCLATLRLPLD